MKFKLKTVVMATVYLHTISALHCMIVLRMTL